MASNRLLGNRQAFLNQTSQVTNVDDTNKGAAQAAALRNSVMTKSTANSDYPNLPAVNQQFINGGDRQTINQNVEDPHADLELDEDELNEIYSRHQMNPDHCF